MLDTDTVENYYKDGNALFSVTIESDKRIEAVNAIREIIGDDNAMTGSVVSTATATQTTVKEIGKISVFAILFVIIVLVFTTTSYFEPVVIMVGLGIAVLINAGSNIIFGEISFVTNAAGNILQLAVSLDYSVFLLHRFTECRKNNPDAKSAMVEALTMSTSSILSSGLTTVIGFVALCLMQFRIGPDLGRALAKGIAISLITVFIFMPVLILSTYKWIDKFEHRPLVPQFNKFGKFVQKITIPVLVIFIMVIAPAYLASNSNSFNYGASKIFGPNTQLGADTEKIQDIFGKSDTYVLIVLKEDKATQKKLSDDLHKISQVSSIISYVDTVGMEIPESYLDEETYSKLCSDKYTRMVISVDAEYEGEETFELVKQIRKIAEKYYPGEWYLAGEGVSTYDLMDTITADMTKVNLVAIGAVFVVLLLTLRSFILPVILVLSIETAIWINLSVPYFTDSKIFYIAYLIISSIQLGATVDYAILMTERYKEYRQTLNKKDAIVNTLSAVTVSILTSGSVLTVVGFLLGIISTHGLLSQLGYFLGKGTLCSLAIVLFALPGLLYLCDRTFIKSKNNVIGE
ncbi:MAG: MMPL family transporter [Lachnospiraceae bacterium]|nr:MMPL family transporter [Lachnospiraceae bacterium]